MRRLKPQEKKRVGEFRLLRGLSEEVNFQRFRKHMARLQRRMLFELKTGTIGRYTLRNGRRRRALSATSSHAAPASRA